MIFLLLLCSMLLAVTPLTADSSPAVPSETRERLVRKCQTCRLTLLDREIIDGKLLDLRSDSLEIEYYVIRDDHQPFVPKVKEFHRRVVSFEEVSSVRCGDSVINGIIWGAAIAALPTLIISSGVTSGDGDPAYRESNSDLVAASTAIAAGIGATLGYLIDRIDNPRYDPDMGELRRAGRDSAR